MHVYTVEPNLGMPIASWLMQLIGHAWISTQERRAKKFFFSFLIVHTIFWPFCCPGIPQRYVWTHNPFFSINYSERAPISTKLTHSQHTTAPSSLTSSLLSTNSFQISKVHVHPYEFFVVPLPLLWSNNPTNQIVRNKSDDGWKRDQKLKA